MLKFNKLPNGYGEDATDITRHTRFPHLNPLPEGEEANESLRKFHVNRQKGFTLVELAIVLVIIGLILAAVLKGQEMIQNAKVKNVANDLRGVASAYYAYQDRYHAIPGDDIDAAAHLGQAAYAGNGDGIINFTAGYTDNAAAVASESQAFWQHTRLAGFTTGTVTAGAAGTAPDGTNALGGLLGVESGTTAAPILGMVGNVVCTGNIPWKIAQAVDTMIDDGNSDTGNVRAGLSTAVNALPEAAAQTVYGKSSAGVAYTPTTSPDETHTLCMKI